MDGLLVSASLEWPAAEGVCAANLAAGAALGWVAAGAAAIALSPLHRRGAPHAAAFRDVFYAIRSRSEVVVDLRLPTALDDDLEDRLVAVAHGPDMATLSLAAGGPPDAAARRRTIAARVRQFEVRLVPEVGSLIELDEAIAAHAGSRTRARPHLVLGGTLELDREGLGALVAQVPAGWSWSLRAHGARVGPVVRRALELGGHIRLVAVSDDVAALGQDAQRAVAELATAATAVGRPLLTESEARSLLGVPEPRHPVG